MKMKKLEKKLESRRAKGKATGPLLISCKRKAYNFYQGQKFDEHNIASMVSCGWKKSKRVGDHFTLMPHDDVSKSKNQMISLVGNMTPYYVCLLQKKIFIFVFTYVF